MMTRFLGVVALMVGLLAGCAGSSPVVPALFDLELASPRAGADSDIIPLSIHALQTPAPIQPRQRVERPRFSLRLKSSDARLQFQYPLLPRRMSTRLTAIARSYFEPEAMGSPYASFLLRLSLPLSLAPDLRRFDTSSSDGAESGLDERASNMASDRDPGRAAKWWRDSSDRASLSEEKLIDDWLADLSLSIPSDDRP